MSRAPILILGALFVLAGCAEKAQTATTRKVDDKPWEISNPAYAAAGFKAGDEAAWANQLKARSQAQNEYNRTVSR